MTSAWRSPRSRKARCTSLQTTVEGVEGVAHPEFDVGDDLIVAAAAGVQFAADVAEPLDEGALDVRMNVFETIENSKFPASISAPMASRASTICSASSADEQADLGEHAGMGLAAEDVVPVEPAVERDGLGEGFDAIVGVAAEPAAPGFLAHDDLTFTPERLKTACWDSEGIILDRGLERLRAQGKFPWARSSVRGADCLRFRL